MSNVKQAVKNSSKINSVLSVIHEGLTLIFEIEHVTKANKTEVSDSICKLNALLEQYRAQAYTLEESFLSSLINSHNNMDIIMRAVNDIDLNVMRIRQTLVREFNNEIEYSSLKIREYMSKRY